MNEKRSGQVFHTSVFTFQWENNMERGMLLPRAADNGRRPFLYLNWKFYLPFIREVSSVLLK